MNKCTKKLSYREAFIEGSDRTLENLLDEALEKTKNTGRNQKINKYEDVFRLILDSKKYLGMTCGLMFLINPGASQPVLIYGDSVDNYTLDAVFTKELAKYGVRGNHSDFVNQILYFAVKENEVVVMSSLSIKASALESYLNWLLGEELKLIPDGSSVILKKTLPFEIRNNIEASPVRKIEIGSSVISGSSSSESGFTLSLPAILDFFGKQFQDKWLDEISAESNISAKLVISYRRKTDEAGQEMMDNLGLALRNAEDVSITLKNNVKISGDDLSLNKTVNISKDVRGLLVSDEIWKAMSEWLIELRKNNET